MNIFPPELNNVLQDDTDLMDKLSREERVEESIFNGVSYIGEDLKGLDVLRCRFVKCDFSGC